VASVSIRAALDRRPEAEVEARDRLPVGSPERRSDVRTRRSSRATSSAASKRSRNWCGACVSLTAVARSVAARAGRAGPAVPISSRFRNTGSLRPGGGQEIPATGGLFPDLTT
jgi:hypothetical protein